jgi:arginine-tRNA-protein transferase
MANKVIDFLFEIGFANQDIAEVLYTEPDGVDNKGNPFYGNDVIFAKVKEEEIWLDLRDTGEMIEAYWEKAWIGGYGTFHRSNFDSYKGSYYKAFPTRYKLWEFKFTKNLRRVLNKNKDLKTVIRPLRITPEKSDLHDTYNFRRHGEMPKKSLLEIYKYLSNYDSKKMELCIFKGKKLVACSFFEAGTSCLYGNSAFWDLDEKERSLGTLTILLEAQYALSRRMFYYYLGHFYAQNPAYHYKARFKGLELYDWDSDCWVDFMDLAHIKEMFKQKLPRR